MLGIMGYLVVVTAVAGTVTRLGPRCLRLTDTGVFHR